LTRERKTCFCAWEGHEDPNRSGGETRKKVGIVKQRPAGGERGHGRWEGTSEVGRGGGDGRWVEGAEEGCGARRGGGGGVGGEGGGRGSSLEGGRRGGSGDSI